MNKKIILVALLTCIVLLSGCLEPQEKCGDGECGPKEEANPAICPQDCPCSQIGEICSSAEVCTGNIVEASDTKLCCLGECKYPLGEEPCGDGKCEEGEPENCPEDCGGILTNEDSPFGVRELVNPLDEQDEVKDLGIKWIQYGSLRGITWERYQELGEKFWEIPDTLYSEAEANGNYISFLVIGSVPDPENPKIHDIPEDMDAYKEFIKKAAKRYPNVKVWEIDQELENQWAEDLSTYALFLKETYKAIKEVNPNAEVAYAGLSSWSEITEGLPEVLSELNKISDSAGDKYFDSISLKWSGMNEKSNYRQRDTGRTGIRSLEEHTSKIKEKLHEAGYANIPIWISATSHYDDAPTDKAGFILPLRTEKEQAIELLKRYVYPISLGLKRMIWITILEYSGSFGLPAGSYFDNVGLINNPKTDGKDWKKLSYYTYKQMTEKLEGSDWDNIENIAEGRDVYVYKFIKNGKPIWVAWSDSGSGQVTINVGSINSVKITEAVPKYDSGQEVTDYSNAFNTQTKTASNGQVTLTLKDTPIFIEETK